MGNQEENEHKIDESSKKEKSHIANRYIKVVHHIEFGEMQQVRWGVRAIEKYLMFDSINNHANTISVRLQNHGSCMSILKYVLKKYLFNNHYVPGNTLGSQERSIKAKTLGTI